MKNRGFDAFCNIGAVQTGASVCGTCGKTDLVVYDDVNRAAGSIAGQFGKVEHLGNHSLPGHSRITMNEDWKNPGPLFVATQSLSCSGLSLDHAVDDFQMTWVWGEMNAHFAPI